jgi:hypothetical protein
VRGISPSEPGQLNILKSAAWVCYISPHQIAMLSGAELTWKGINMGLTKENQQLQNALISAAHLLRWSLANMLKEANSLADSGKHAEAQALIELSANYQESESSLLSYASDVRDGLISKTSSA